MELDDTSLAIGRIERALSRLEKAISNRPVTPPPVASDGDQTALKAEVAAVIGELDKLIAEAGRG